MKLRRALATAAATAVIGPTALLVAPYAFATGESPAPSASPDPSVTPSVSSTPSTSPSPVVEPPASSAPPSPAAPSSATTSVSTSTSTGEPGPSATSGSPTAGPSSTSTSSPDACEEYSDEARIKTELLGLPSKIVAGSGWQDFTYRTTNTSDRELRSVVAYMDVWTWDGRGEGKETSQYLTVQWYDPQKRAWQPLPEDFGDFAETENLGPRQYADAKLRLKIDAKAPAGYGSAFQAGSYTGHDGKCGDAEGSIYSFDVLPVGSKPGKVDDAKGTTGRPGPSQHANRPAARGSLSTLPVTGELARTGSSSGLPTIAVLSGAAVAVGAGAVFVVRRRKADAAG
ncbi:hypothetical protein ACFY41_28340 [Streptomyces syringium]|uniref:hypothetical protein n=1 Tax=Streptomyces syringium TaxID=76729 RepID=UPI0036849AAE